MDEAGAMAVVEVAAALRETGQLDKAMGLYEYARGITKGTKAETMARAGRAQIWVTQGKDEDVKAEVNRIIADANSLPDADKAVLVIGEEYYLNAEKIRQSQGIEAAKAAYEKTIQVLKDFINNLPKSKEAPQAYIGIAYCEYILGHIQESQDIYQYIVETYKGTQQAKKAAGILSGTDLP